MEPGEPLSARDEIRVSEYGLLRCPSCGGLAAEILMTSHCLILVYVPISDERRAAIPEHLREYITQDIEAECRDGGRVTLADYDQAVAATNISLADAVNFAERQHYRWLYYPKPGGFTGLMSVLGEP